MQETKTERMVYALYWLQEEEVKAIENEEYTPHYHNQS